MTFDEFKQLLLRAKEAQVALISAERQRTEAGLACDIHRTIFDEARKALNIAQRAIEEDPETLQPISAVDGMCPICRRRLLPGQPVSWNSDGLMHSQCIEGKP